VRPLHTMVAALGVSLLGATATARAQGIDEDHLREILEHAAAEEQARSLDRTADVETDDDRAFARELRRTLDTRRVTVNFDGVSFKEALDFLRDVTGLNIVVSKAALEAIGEREVHIRLRDVRLRSCLEVLLQQLDPDLRYGVRHGVLVIGMNDEWKRSLSLVLYFVGDLVHQPPDFPGPKMGLDGKIIEDDGH
jgi:hypothetical protein